ncbi:ferric reductase like transmembrane component-domain-containing protein [Clohesyomyces aquaticus]|uniref:ferric-chelate reductase (NADPH) n=1 Tax=Clohesyomyces aquaticus TaxID=1231657 RepID=A0A1Y1ZQN7_9PLEO|nr:ferric reductase like transmembrane component-domain-containing protein [Clohesyomyces aquaticus]
MAFGYGFPNLNDDQKHARRVLLDFYPQVAQWSALAVFALFQFAFLFSWLTCRGLAYERPRSPSFSKRTERTWLKASQQSWDKLLWWMKKPVFPNWGTTGEWVGGGVWTTWLLYLSFAQTGNDYMHLTKRFGIIGASQLPLHYLLALRSPYSPIQYLTRLSHEQLKAPHQALGRIIYLFFLLHVAFYLNGFVQLGFLAKRIKDKDVILGLLSISLFTILSTTSLEPLRRWNYRVFFTTHVLIASTVLVPLYFHVSHIRPYILETIAVFLLHQILRILSTKIFPGTITLLPGTQLVQIRIPLSSSSTALKWKPGQHVYLRHPSPSTSLFRLQNNPFTIASLPAKDKQLLLIARTLNGTTKHLADLARSLSSRDGGIHASIPLTLEGPYGASSHVPNLVAFDRILFVAGGVGATFVVPVWRSVVEESGSGDAAASSVVNRVRFIWAVRKLAETRWVFPESASISTSGSEMHATTAPVEIFVSRPSGADLQVNANGDADDIELAEHDQLLGFEEQMHSLRKGVVVHSGRPKMDRIIEEVFGKGLRVAVLVCGPRGLVEEVRERVGWWVGRGAEVWVHEEVFGW